MSPKFIVSAYDLLSYFSQDENNYHYIITNPFEFSDNNTKVLLLANNILNDFENNFKRYETIYDKDLYADFIIDKNERKIKGIDIKTSYGLINFKTDFKAYNITKEQFFGIHDPEQCVEYQ